MYVITNKTDNVLIGMGLHLDHMSNGYPRLIDENTAYPTEMVNVFDVTEVIPEGVEQGKYCYTESEGFYKNPNYVEPVDLNKEVPAMKSQQAAMQDALDYLLMNAAT